MSGAAETILRVAGLSDRILDDLVAAHELFRSRDGDPFSRRVLLRTAYSSFEGEVASMRNMVVEAMNLHAGYLLSGFHKGLKALETEVSIDLTDKEFCLAMDRDYREFCEGVQNPRASRLCLEKSLKGVFRLHGKVFRHEIDPDFRGDGWQLFLRLKSKRNAITHPTSVEDYELSSEDGRMTEVLCLWIGQFFNAANLASVDRMRAFARRLGLSPQKLAKSPPYNVQKES